MTITPRLIKLSGIILTTIATLITATAFFLPYLLDINSYRSEIETALEQRLNRQVYFDSGSFAWHFGPSFDFKKFIVKERDGVKDFITAEQITVELAFIPLLKKNVELKNVVLNSTVISLSRSIDGKLNIDDLLNAPSNNLNLNFNKIIIQNGAFLWKDMTGGKRPFLASLTNISMVANHLNPGQKGHVKLSAEIPAIKGVPTKISFSGKIHLPSDKKSLLETFIDGDLSVKELEIARFWQYFDRFIPFANSGGRMDFLTKFKGTVQDFAAKGDISLYDATVKWPEVFHTPLLPKTVQINYTVAMNKSLIDFTALNLRIDDFRIKGSFQMLDYSGKDPHIIAKATTPSTFRYEDVKKFVPYGIIKDADTVDYIENKIKTGVFKLESALLNGKISQISHMEIGENYNTLMIRGHVENGILSYGAKAPTFNNLKGIIELKGKNFNLLGITGYFGISPFSLNGSITEYNTDKLSDYPISMNILVHQPEMVWLAKTAGIPSLKYSGISSLQLSGNGHISAYQLNGNWDLKQSAYSLQGYVSKPISILNNVKFSSIIGKDSTKITSLNYNLQPIIITGSGLIGYWDKPYLGFDLQSNRFEMNENVPILSMWKQYKLKGTVQAHIKGGGDPVDMSAMDYNGTVNLSKFSILPDDQLKQLTDMNAIVTFKGNKMETNNFDARYGTSTVSLKAAIKSLKKPEGDIKLSSSQFFLKDINRSINNREDAVRRVNSDFTIHNDFITIKNLSGAINSSNFHLNGIYQSGHKPAVNLFVTSNKLDINDLLLFSTTEQSSDSRQTSGINIKLIFNVEDGTFKKFEFNKLYANIQRENGTYYLQNMKANLPGGKISAKGRIDSSGNLGDRYDLTFDITNADAEKLFYALDISREVTGNLTLHGGLTAKGNNLIEIKKSALGNLRINLSDGKIRKLNTLSKVFSILNVSQLLKFKLPDMASGGMPYNSIKGSIAVKDGILSTEDLFINSNAINVSIVGTTDIVKEEINLILGVQPLQTVDKIVNRIPIVGWLLTGKDKDLITAYFEAKGKWSDPQVNPIQVKSMSQGILNVFIRAFQLPVKLFTDTGEVILGK